MLSAINKHFLEPVAGKNKSAVIKEMSWMILLCACTSAQVFAPSRRQFCRPCLGLFLDVCPH